MSNNSAKEIKETAPKKSKGRPKKETSTKVVSMVQESAETTENKAPGKSKVEYKNRLGLQEAVSYFEALVAGLKKGQIELKQDENHLTLSPESEVVVEVKASAKEDKGKVSFKISWEKAQASELKIS